MGVQRIVAVSILVGVLGWAGQASAGWVIDQVVKGIASGQQQVMVEANRMKTVTLDPSGRPTAAFIVDLDADTITQVDYAHRQFTTGTLQEYAQAITAAVQAATGQMAGAMKAMDEAMKDMPPEQRKMMEQMLRSQGQSAGGEVAACQEPRIEVRKTGQQATIAGQPAVRYEILADGKPETELWIAPGIAVSRELDLQKLERFAREIAKAAPGCGPGQRRQGLPGSDPAWKLAGDGYPVRTVSRDAGITVEVVKAESRSVATAEFQPPAGFARKTLKEMMGQ